jgi:hypothetical protein
LTVHQPVDAQRMVEHDCAIRLHCGGTLTVSLPLSATKVSPPVLGDRYLRNQSRRADWRMRRRYRRLTSLRDTASNHRANRLSSRLTGSTAELTGLVS